MYFVQVEAAATGRSVVQSSHTTVYVCVCVCVCVYVISILKKSEPSKAFEGQEQRKYNYTYSTGIIKNINFLSVVWPDYFWSNAIA